MENKMDFEFEEVKTEIFDEIEVNETEISAALGIIACCVSEERL